MRYSLIAAVLAAACTVVVGVGAVPAEAASKPCGTFTLQATNAASADSFDTNQDRLECLSDSPGTGRDNTPILAPGAVFDGYKLYAFEDRADDGVVSVQPSRNRFRAWTYGQEDDPDWNGCLGRCLHRLSYDRNDYFYVDFGHGSRTVSLARFERLLPGSEVFSTIYELDPGQSSVFSLDG